MAGLAKCRYTRGFWCFSASFSSEKQTNLLPTCSFMTLDETLNASSIDNGVTHATRLVLRIIYHLGKWYWEDILAKLSNTAFQEHPSKPSNSAKWSRTNYLPFFKPGSYNDGGWSYGQWGGGAVCLSYHSVVAHGSLKEHGLALRTQYPTWSNTYQGELYG